MIEPPISFHGLTTIRTEVKISETKAIVTVVSKKLQGCAHVIYWDGEEVFDPNDENATAFDDYLIKEFWPLHRIEQ